MPLEAMVPRAAEPPGAPLTDQLTEVLELPETVAVNWKVLPERMLAVVGETLTEVEAGVPGLLGLPPELLLELLEPVAAQPMATTAANRAATTGKDLARGRMAVRTHLGRQEVGDQCGSNRGSRILDRREEQGQGPR